MNLLRRLRGAVGTALTWAMGWAPVGAVWAGYIWLTIRSEFAPPFWTIIYPISMWALWGAVGGTAFSGALAFAERRRQVDELSVRRVALWGALGGLAMPVAVFAMLRLVYGMQGGYLAPLVSMGAVSLSLGAGSAVGTLLLARRAPDDGQPRLGAPPGATPLSLSASTVNQ